MAGSYKQPPSQSNQHNKSSAKHKVRFMSLIGEAGIALSAGSSFGAGRSVQCIVAAAVLVGQTKVYLYKLSLARDEMREKQ